MGLKVHMIEEIGTRAYLRVYWGKDCPSTRLGHTHNAIRPLVDSPSFEDWKLGGNIDDYIGDCWPTHCEYCGAEVPVYDGGIQVHRQVHRDRLYNTESGHPEPGDMFWAKWRHDSEWEHFYCPWDNCNDSRGHLHVILPDGHEWDIDGRCNNCTLPEDKLHRCWVREGEPPNITVGKGGNTCSAGAGSVMSGSWHGFLINGELVEC